MRKDRITETDLKKAIDTLWQAQVMAEIIGDCNVEEMGVNVITLQTAMKGVSEMIFKALDNLGEL